jgi:4-azaleucine resistance transporter AzlC
MPPPSRRSEFIAGARAQLPLLLGVTPFGLAFGAYAVDSGLSPTLSEAMSVIVFGGASQFVGARQMAAGVPGAVIILTAALVNLRHMLYSASLAPYTDHLAARWRWPLAYLLTDEAYVMAIARYREPDASPNKHWFFLGTGVALWVCWQVSTVAGVVLGGAVPPSWSLDFALPLTFIALVVPTLSDRPSLAAASVAGVLAAAAFRWPYGTGTLISAIAGIAAAVALSQWLDRGGREETAGEGEAA